MRMKPAALGAIITLGLALGGGRAGEAASLRAALDRPDLDRAQNAGSAGAPLLTPVRNGRNGARGRAFRAAPFQGRAIGGDQRRRMLLRRAPGQNYPLVGRPPAVSGAPDAWIGSRAWRGDPGLSRRYYSSPLRRRPLRVAPYYGYYGGGWAYPSYGWTYAGWPFYAAPSFGLAQYDLYYDTAYSDMATCYRYCRSYYGPGYCRRYARYYCF